MTTSSGMTFGGLLRRYRKAAGLTQKGLAERALLSAFTVSALERGANQSPRKDTLALLADALGLEPAERAALEAAARSATAPAASPPAPQLSPAPPTTPRPVGPLVGRGHELALLDRHLAGEGPPVLLLAGEPGIGKSRLLQEAHVRAQAADWAVLAGGCQRGGGQDPYAPLPAALEGRLRRTAPEQAPTELAGCAWLARLLPEVTELCPEPLPGWTLAPAQERRLVVRAAERYLRNVAGPAGTLLVLDDLQWAGPDGLAVLASLLEGVEEAPPGEPLAALVADLLSKGRATLRDLEPLPPSEAAALLDALLTDRPALAEDRAEVVRRAGGLPFFLVSCADGLAAGGMGTRVPGSVAQSVRQRVAALSPAAQEVLRAAAVVGREAERAVLTATVGQPRPEVLEGLEAACRAHLLEEEGSAAYRFAHDLVREVVEGDLSAGRRAALHQRVAEALEARAADPDLEVLAFHYSRSDAREKALLYLERAGDRAAAAGAHTAAEGYYRDLLCRIEAGGGDRAVARVCAKLGMLWGEAEETLAQTSARFESLGDINGLIMIERMRAELEILQGRPAAALARLHAALAREEVHDTVFVLPLVAWAHLLLGEHNDAGRVSVEDIARARSEQTLLALPDALRVRALVTTELQRWEEAEQAIAEGLALARRMPFPYAEARLLHAYGQLHSRKGEPGAARERLQEAQAIFQRLGAGKDVERVEQQLAAAAQPHPEA